MKRICALFLCGICVCVVWLSSSNNEDSELTTKQNDDERQPSLGQPRVEPRQEEAVLYHSFLSPYKGTELDAHGMPVSVANRTSEVVVWKPFVIRDDAYLSVQIGDSLLLQTEIRGFLLIEAPDESIAFTQECAQDEQSEFCFRQPGYYVIKVIQENGVVQATARIAVSEVTFYEPRICGRGYPDTAPVFGRVLSQTICTSHAELFIQTETTAYGKDVQICSEKTGKHTVEHRLMNENSSLVAQQEVCIFDMSVFGYNTATQTLSIRISPYAAGLRLRLSSLGQEDILCGPQLQQQLYNTETQSWDGLFMCSVSAESQQDLSIVAERECFQKEQRNSFAFTPLMEGTQFFRSWKCCSQPLMYAPQSQLEHIYEEGDGFLHQAIVYTDDTESVWVPFIVSDKTTTYYYSIENIEMKKSLYMLSDDDLHAGGVSVPRSLLGYGARLEIHVPAGGKQNIAFQCELYQQDRPLKQHRAELTQARMQKDQKGYRLDLVTQWHRSQAALTKNAEVVYDVFAQTAGGNKRHLVRGEIRTKLLKKKQQWIESLYLDQEKTQKFTDIEVVLRASATTAIRSEYCSQVCVKVAEGRPLIFPVNGDDHSFDIQSSTKTIEPFSVHLSSGIHNAALQDVCYDWSFPQRLFLPYEWSENVSQGYASVVLNSFYAYPSKRLMERPVMKGDIVSPSQIPTVSNESRAVGLSAIVPVYQMIQEGESTPLSLHMSQPYTLHLDYPESLQRGVHFSLEALDTDENIFIWQDERTVRVKRASEQLMFISHIVPEDTSDYRMTISADALSAYEYPAHIFVSNKEQPLPRFRFHSQVSEWNQKDVHARFNDIYVQTDDGVFADVDIDYEIRFFTERLPEYGRLHIPAGQQRGVLPIHNYLTFGDECVVQLLAASQALLPAENIRQHSIRMPKNSYICSLSPEKKKIKQGETARIDFHITSRQTSLESFCVLKFCAIGLDSSMSLDAAHLTPLGKDLYQITLSKSVGSLYLESLPSSQIAPQKQVTVTLLDDRENGIHIQGTSTVYIEIEGRLPLSEVSFVPVTDSKKPVTLVINPAFTTPTHLPIYAHQADTNRDDKHMIQLLIPPGQKRFDISNAMIPLGTVSLSLPDLSLNERLRSLLSRKEPYVVHLTD